MKFAQRRDYYAGALIMLLGGGAAILGSRYNIGSLTRMGPGFFPTALGILLAVMGVLIAGSASYGPKSGAVETALRPDWRGWLCIVSGAGLFIVLASRAGLVPATLACVFVAAMGDRANNWKNALCLAIGVTIFGTLLFAYGLRVQIPILGSM
jgi:hypothetical protein